MNNRNKLEIKKLATAFFLAVFMFFASSSNVLAASQNGNITKNLVDKVESAVYSDTNDVNPKAKSESTNDSFVSDSKREKLLDPAQIPAVKQSAIDRSDPDNNLLEKAASAFKNAGDLAP